MSTRNEADNPWYAGVTGYQWLVLVIACLGWIFDVFEGQLFAVFKTPAMADLLGEGDHAALVDWFGNVGLASFLIGGALGGIVFGVLADKFGRKQSMVWSILTYSVFTGLHYFATDPWHIVILRFFVAMGVAGEWAVAVSLIAEVFPPKARALAGGIFHASSVLGVVLASGVGMVLADADWRVAFLIGLIPGLLVVWVLVSLKESEKWQSTAGTPQQSEKKAGGSLGELLGTPQWRNRALIGLGLAAVGLGTYWGIFAWVPELVREVLGDTVSEADRSKSANFVYLFMNVTGGLAGLLLFAPISIWTSRRIAFAIFHLGALIMVPVAYLCPTEYWHTLVLLPCMAFFVLGMHAGYAVYFPELFPTRMRATGSSFCFNVGRLVSAVLLLFRGQLREMLDLRWAVSAMALLFLVGLVLLIFAPETKNQELPE